MGLLVAQEERGISERRLIEACRLCKPVYRGGGLAIVKWPSDHMATRRGKARGMNGLEGCALLSFPERAGRQRECWRGQSRQSIIFRTYACTAVMYLGM